MTLAQLQARLAGYLDAEDKLMQSQEYTVGQGGTARRNRRVDLSEVRAAIDALNVQIAAHPDNAAARAVARVRHLRPLY